MILVLGTGRCGTTEISRILHELGVNMGKTFYDEEHRSKPQPLSNDCTFEDSEFVDMNMRFVMMNEKFRKIERKEPFGVKDPNMSSHPKLLQEYLNLKPYIIRSTRDKDDTIKSFMKVYGYSKERGTELHEERTHNLSKIKADLEIDCKDTNKKDKIKNWLLKESIV